jgi:hypothetical protein
MRLNDAYGMLLLFVVATYVAASLTGFRGWSGALVVALGCFGAVVGLASAKAPAVQVRRAFVAAGLAVSCAVLAEILDDRRVLLAVAGLLETGLLAWAAGVVLSGVIRESQVSFRTILGAVSVYMIFGLLFVSIFVVIDRIQPGPFFGDAPRGTGDFMFFSFTTLTTTGYGDLVPAAQPGRMFAGLEMLLGQIFLVTLIAGLVSLWRPRRPSGSTPA